MGWWNVKESNSMEGASWWQWFWRFHKRQDPLYEPVHEGYDGSHSESGYDYEEIYDTDEVDEPFKEENIVEEGNNSDDELKQAREMVKGKVFELAQQLQRETAAGKLSVNEKSGFPCVKQPFGNDVCVSDYE